MARPHCRLLWYASGAHLDQLFTGFLMLEAAGFIRLSQAVSPEPLRSTLQHQQDVGGAHLTVLLDGELRIHYDCHDSVELNDEQLEQCDLYFKRSFSRQYVERLERHRDKVLPLGLCYHVLPDAHHWRSVHRALIARAGWSEKLAALLDALDAGNWLKYNPRLRDLQGLPDVDLSPRVLFLAAAYDPHSDPGRSKQKIEERIATNDTRARCIELLRKELGERFLGGFAHSPYAVRAYRAFLVADNEITRKRNYIRVLRSFPICIATTGLHGSIGWKFAEYVALAKAIVSEKLGHEVAGDLQAGRNYLEFSSPDECARQATRLMEDREQRARLMFNNALYYRSYLRPDALVLNSLLQALSTQRAADITLAAACA